jgi:hypothetical protein
VQDLSWQVVGIGFCLAFVLFALVMVLIENYRATRKKLYRPSKDCKRRSVEAVTK